MTLHSAFGPWSTFYSLIGTSASALTGLMFVVVTLVNRESGAATQGIKTYSTPTVLHFAVALFVAALSVAPWHSLVPAGLIVAALGAYGVFHVAHAAVGARRTSAYVADVEDRVAYMILPIAAYAALTLAGVLLVVRPGGAMFVLAASCVLLLFIGIRNAWDLVTFIVSRDPSEPSSPSPAPRSMRDAASSPPPSNPPDGVRVEAE